MNPSIFAKKKDTFANNALKQLILKCLNPNLAARPMPQDLLQDTFMKSTRFMIEKEDEGSSGDPAEVLKTTLFHLQQFEFVSVLNKALIT